MAKVICGVYASTSCKEHHREQAQRILGAAADVVWVDGRVPHGCRHGGIRKRTGLLFPADRGPSPAAGAELGLPAEDAMRLAIRTAEGAGAMMAGDEAPPDVLRQRVTSPGGTTQAALEQFQADQFRDIVRRAVAAADNRGRELAG